MRMIRLISQLVFAFSLAVSPIWVSGEEPSTAALEVLDRFMTAFNAQDSEAWALTLHYPHVRFASQTVKVYNDPASFDRRKFISRLSSSVSMIAMSPSVATNLCIS